MAKAKNVKLNVQQATLNSAIIEAALSDAGIRAQLEEAGGNFVDVAAEASALQTTISEQVANITSDSE